MSQRNITLSGTAEHFKMLDAFFLLAETGGSMQARIARAELGKLTEAQKLEISSKCDFNQIAFNNVVNTMLLNALNKCERNRKREAPEGMNYGNDVIIRHNPTIYAHERLLCLGGSSLQFLWLAHSRFEFRSKGDRYVDIWFVRADSEIEINGRASDIVKLFNKSKVSEIIPQWFSHTPEGRILPIDMSKMTKGRIVVASR